MQKVTQIPASHFFAYLCDARTKQNHNHEILKKAQRNHSYPCSIYSHHISLLLPKEQRNDIGREMGHSRRIGSNSYTPVVTSPQKGEDAQTARRRYEQ